MIAQAKQIIFDTGCSVAAVTMSGEIYTDKGPSVRPLYRIYTAHKQALRGAAVADKIIGKAAACLLCDAAVSGVFAFLMSVSALELLQRHHIKADYQQLVPFIENRTATDLCPMEKTVVDCDDLSTCIKRIAQFIETVPLPE